MAATKIHYFQNFLSKEIRNTSGSKKPVFWLIIKIGNGFANIDTQLHQLFLRKHSNFGKQFTIFFQQQTAQVLTVCVNGKLCNPHRLLH